MFKVGDQVRVTLSSVYPNRVGQTAVVIGLWEGMCDILFADGFKYWTGIGRLELLTDCDVVFGTPDTSDYDVALAELLN